jgi:hypothetical protein
MIQANFTCISWQETCITSSKTSFQQVKLDPRTRNGSHNNLSIYLFPPVRSRFRFTSLSKKKSCSPTEKTSKMVFCCVPGGICCYPMYLLLLRPLWDLLANPWQDKLTAFWNNTIYPIFIHPWLSRLPEKVQKFLVLSVGGGRNGRNDRKNTGKNDNGKLMSPCCASGSGCGSRGSRGCEDGGEVEKAPATVADSEGGGDNRKTK